MRQSYNTADGVKYPLQNGYVNQKNQSAKGTPKNTIMENKDGRIELS